MSKLMTISSWVELHYISGSEPDEATVIQWIENGELAGERQGERYYVQEGAVYISSQTRGGEAQLNHPRSARLVKKGVPWYFLTRDDEDDQGPFETEQQAREALTRFMGHLRGARDKAGK
jgi:hypothetical protein